MTYSSTIAAGGEKQGRRWEFSVGWAGTDREVAAIHRAEGAEAARDRPGRPLHPRYRKRGCRPGETGGPALPADRHQRPEQVAWLDTRHRSHVQVEDDVEQAKAVGLNRWPSQHWAINVAWTRVAALDATLLACFRHLA